MRKFYFLLIALFVEFSLNAQVNYIHVCPDCNTMYHFFNFSSPTDSSWYYFLIDNSQPDNIWQTGIPQKSAFTYGYYSPKVLVTDTINPYPVNNLSSFQFSILNCSWDVYSEYCGGYTGLAIGFIYKINTDASLDGGTIEVSHSGSPFINIIDDPLAYVSSNIYTSNDTVASLGKPGISGSNDEWQIINVDFQHSQEPGMYDTITMRFTFASDSIQTNKDGWMFGAIHIVGMYEGINETQNHEMISVYPNPVTDELKITNRGRNKNPEITIIDITGHILYQDKLSNNKSIDTSHLPNGIYLLRYTDSNQNYAVKRFMVQH